MTIFKSNNLREGYIAVTSAIIIMVVLMAIIFTVSFSGFVVRFGVQETYYKQVSRGLAESCVADARLKLASNILYAGDETILVGADNCQILPIESTLLTRTIKAKAIFRTTVTNLKVVLNLVGLTVSSWEELPNF